MAESPVDINKLASVLNKSKALLDTVDRQFGSSSNISEGKLPEKIHLWLYRDFSLLLIGD